MTSNKRPFVDLFPLVEWNKRDSFCKKAYDEGYGAVAVLPEGKLWTVTPEDLLIWKCNSSEGTARLIPMPMATLGNEPLMSEIRLMSQSGSVPLFYGGSTLGGNPLVLRNTLSYCSDLKVRIVIVPDEPSLNEGGMVNEGMASSLSGMKGIPPVGETTGALKAMNFASEFGSSIHLHNISTEKTLEEIKNYRDRGLDVTCSVTMSHLCYSEKDLIDSYWDPRFKVKVPLRSEKDRLSLWSAIEEGSIEAVTTGHVPVSVESKKAPFEKAPFGIASMCGGLRELLKVWDKEMSNRVSLRSLLATLTTGPSELLCLEETPSLEEAEAFALSILKEEI